jgi:GH24 family phage-related lysozyme (muramidase)
MKIVDREAFFNGIRPLYGGHLTQPQVDEMDSALDDFEAAFAPEGEEAALLLAASWVESADTLVLSAEGEAVLVEREGLRTNAYLDSVGVWTIGVGHTAACGPPEPCAGMTITEAEALEIFARDTDVFEDEVNRLVTVPLTQWEFDALVSFTYNVGASALAGSTLLRKLNDGDKAGACEQFMEWDIPPEIIPRRRAEQACFGEAVYVARID